jgi:glycosyltransferase involved in cell wall biosynthesis
MAKFSIILPVRNGGDYVKECIHSILSQTCQDFNLHVLDNQSTDSTLEWIQSLDDNRIKIHRSEKPLTIEENWARVKAIEKNEFMTMLGHDDLLYPNYLKEMDKLIEKHPRASLYQGHYMYIDSKGKPLRPCLPMDEVQYGYEFLACQMMQTIESTGTGYMMRSKDYDEIDGMSVRFPNLIFADYHLWVQLASISYKATTPIGCFAYRIHESVSKITKGQDYITAFETYVYFLASLRNKEGFKQVIERYGKSYLLEFCQSLSHRLLKTPRSKRTLTVKQFIVNCRNYAQLLIPNQEFDPLSKPLTRIAQQLDYNVLGRQAFAAYQKIKRK